MSNDIQKADQIAYRIFTKLTLVINQARSTADTNGRAQPKVDKWFNLETPDSEIFRDHLRIYRSVSGGTPPPFELQVLLSVPELTSNQVLAYHAPDSSRVRIEPTPRYILLETWVLVFTPSPPSSPSPYGTGYGDGDSTATASTSNSTTASGEVVAPSTMYKHCIPFFRSLFSLLRILPTWKLFKRLRRRTSGGNRNANLGIRLRVRGFDDGGSTVADDCSTILGFDTAPSQTHAPLPTATHVFPSIPHPTGTLSLTTRYLSTPNFRLDELESLLSSRFLSLDEGPEFTPTLASKQQQGMGTGIGTSPLGSLPIRTSLPKSPPASIADRFILPLAGSGSGPVSLHSRTTSLPPPPPPSALQSTQQHHQRPSSSSSKSTSNQNSPRHLNVVLPVSRTATPAGGPTTTTAGVGTPAGSGSGISVGSSSRGQDATGTSSAWSKDDGVGGVGGSGTGKQTVSGIAARLRKESTGAGRGADLPSSPGPLPIRRPSINPVHPFKASTLSSGSPSIHSPSPSLRQPSPLSSANTGGPSRPSSISVAPTTSPPTSRVPPSPIGMGSRPSPPFAPSSLGDRRSLASAEGGDESPSPQMETLGLGAGTGTGAGTGKKRYSSSFKKRYSATGTSGSGGAGGSGGGAGSEGSTGSGDRERERKDSERVGSGGGSFLSNNTDDDDISVFVQEIDARKPLSGHQRLQNYDRDATEPGHRRDGRSSGHGGNTDCSRGGADEKPIAGLLSTDERPPSSSSTGPMLTSELEVDERLRIMNQAFLESLEGLGGGRRKVRRSSPSGPGGEVDYGSERLSEHDPTSRRMSREESESRDGNGGGGGMMGRGRGLGLASRRPSLHSRSTSTSDVGAAVQGSDEVLGRLSLDDERRRSRAQ